MILADFGNGKLPDGRTLTLDTKVCNEEWLPESLPLPDPRKAGITVRNLLNMASGLGAERSAGRYPFETALGHVEGSPYATLKGDPGTAFNYSNAGDAHLVLLFNHATGKDLFPFLKPRLLDPIGMERGPLAARSAATAAIGPVQPGLQRHLHDTRASTPGSATSPCTGASGTAVVSSPRPTMTSPGPAPRSSADYGGQWWVSPRIPGAPDDLAMTLGRDHNDGFVVPSLDLIFVRLGDGEKYPKAFKEDLVRKVLAAVEK